MDRNELILRLKRYPKSIVEFLMLSKSRYITIYHMSRFAQAACKEYMYDLIEDGIVEKYQTTFRLTDEFVKLRGQL